MKRLTQKTHEKVVLAAIILSCGLVMHADPPAKQKQAKAGPAVSHPTEHSATAADRSHSSRPSKTVRLREQASLRSEW